MNEEEIKAIVNHFKYCIENNVIRDEEYVLMSMEKVLNLIENSISKDKIREIKEKYEKKCAVLGRHNDNAQWYEMGKIFGKADLCEELLGE